MDRQTRSDPRHGTKDILNWTNTGPRLRRCEMNLTRALLEVDKYAPDKSSKWKRVNAHFPALYKALLAEPDAATRGARLRQAVSAAR